MLPKEIKEYIFLLKTSQEEIDRRRELWNCMCEDIVNYGELKRRWGLGHFVALNVML